MDRRAAFKAAAAFALSAAGLGVIVQSEGTKTKAYLDTGGVWTICTGHTRTAKKGMTASAQLCAELLREDTADAVRTVQKLVTAPITQGMFDALVSFVFNIGETQFRTSTLLRYLNEQQYLAAANQFPRWIYDNGVKQNGLVKRRQLERTVFLEGFL